MQPPRALIIAGPNGAGKTTFALEYLPREGGFQAFFNADLIAAGLAPLAVESAAWPAAKLMARAMDAAVEARQDFAVETTLSGRSYLGLIRGWQRAGYQVELIFLRLSQVELALERVHIRVRQGGHSIPDEVIRRRFTQGWSNFESLYAPLVQRWQAYLADGPVARVLGVGLPVSIQSRWEADAPAGVAAAFQRAARQAVRVAEQSGTMVAIASGGTVRLIAPQEAVAMMTGSVAAEPTSGRS